ncbi:MAG: hypothetical protein KDG50_13315 [Chromatiales bacterium]|nr:hypothetical protein [Chromatiales bacterium]
MNTSEPTILTQLRRNAVALISLFVALTSLGYNTWRNEQTEANRNQRQAAFEVLLKLGELQQLVFHSHYDRDVERGNPRAGWAHVLTIMDLAEVLGGALSQRIHALSAVWEANWEALESSEQGTAAVLDAIQQARTGTVGLLKSLQ